MILECHTAKHKLREVQYFLKKLGETEIWNNDEIFDFYLNTFVISSAMVIDYVHSDFIFNVVKPSIHWSDWDKARKNDVELMKLINSHPQKEDILLFRKFFKDKKANLLQRPLTNYFIIKRHMISHRGWQGHKFSLFTEYPDGIKKVHKRYLENEITLNMRAHKKAEKPEIDIEDMIPLDMFHKKIPERLKEKTLERISSESLLVICKDYVEELSDFISKFEGQEFLK